MAIAIWHFRIHKIAEYKDGDRFIISFISSEMVSSGSLAGNVRMDKTPLSEIEVRAQLAAAGISSGAVDQGLNEARARFGSETT